MKIFVKLLINPSVTMAPNTFNQSKNSSANSRLRHGHSKSLTNLYYSSGSSSSGSVNSGTGSENFILSSGVQKIGILRRALVAAREGDLQTLQVNHINIFNS